METLTAPSPPLDECNNCGKKASSSTKIRACTRCYSVGYCSKSCQKADWLPSKTEHKNSNESSGYLLSNRRLVGHKYNCFPRSKTDGTKKSTIVDIAKSSSSSSSLSKEKGVVRLEMKCDEGSWTNVGPIHLVDKFDEAITNSQSTSHFHKKSSKIVEKVTAHNTCDNLPSLLQSQSLPQPQRNVGSKPNHLKDLPKKTQKLLNNAAKSCYSYHHSPDGVDENLLIFFHGAGDTHIPFDNLGRKMELPQTAILSLSASMTISRNGDHECSTTTENHSSRSKSSSFVELPFGLGYTWFEEMDYESTGMTLPPDHPRRLKSLGNALEAIDLLICSLTGKCREDDVATQHGENNDIIAKSDDSWIPERIFLFGFSAGACLVMEICRLWSLKGRMPLGGAICIGGGVKTPDLPLIAKECSISYEDRQKQHSLTDVLITTGSNDMDYPPNEAMKSRKFYSASNVKLHVQKGKGHEMIKSREEMQVIMEFLSKRLVRRMVSMEGLKGCMPK